MKVDFQRNARNIGRLIVSILFCWLYIPHLLCYAFGGGRDFINQDVIANKSIVGFSLPIPIALVCLLHTNRYFRTLFYFRIGPKTSLLISWYRPGDRYFMISYSTKIGAGVKLNHPYSTVLNAESIGSGFSCVNCTTIGLGKGGRPRIGNNVALGANCVVVGNVKIGDNVTIGAGSVVVKDIPNNCVAVGNPCKVIRYKTDA